MQNAFQADNDSFMLWNMDLGARTSRDGFKKDMRDLFEIRRSGGFYAAAETRWSMIEVDKLVLDHGVNEVDSLTMQRVTDKFWKPFAYEIDRSFTMYGLVVWKTKKIKTFVGDDPARIAKHGSDTPKYAETVVPYIVPYLSYDLKIDRDPKDGTLTYEVLDPKTGNPMRDVQVTESRRGGYSPETKTFDSDCGAVLTAWRRFQRIQNLHDRLVENNAAAVPFLERLPVSEQVRLYEGAGRIENAMHEPDQYGLPNVKDKTVLKLVEPKTTNARPYVEVPQEFRIAANQVRGSTSESMIEIERKNLMELYASTLQLPLRFVSNELVGNSLRTESSAAVDEDVLRAVHVASERRNEIVDVLKEAFFVCYGEGTVNVHLPAKKPLKIETLYELHERGFIDDAIAAEEISSITSIETNRIGKKRPRITNQDE